MLPPVPQPGSRWSRLKQPLGNALSDFGYGLSQGGFKDAFGIAAQRGAQMQPYRDQQTEARKAEMEKSAQSNATVEWLRNQAQQNPNNPQLQQIMQGLEMGVLGPAEAYNAALLAQAAPEPVKGIEINGRLVNPMTGEEMGNFADPAQPQQPWSVSPGETLIDPATGQPIFTGPAKPDANMPTGYIPDPDTPGGMMPAPGSPDDLRRQEAERARTLAGQHADANIEAAQRAIEIALQQTSGMTAGNVMGQTGGIPFLGQGAANLGSTLDTIKAFLGFDALQAMREASPTGGALGQVAVQELMMLQATVASLDQRQGHQQLAANLAFINQRLENLKRIREMAEQQPGGQQQTPGGTTSTGVPWSIE